MVRRSLFNIVILASLALLSYIKIADAASCSCGGSLTVPGSLTYTAVSDSGCQQYIVSPPGVTMTCPSDLIFDTMSCVCNYPQFTTCPSECQGTTQPPTTTTMPPPTTTAPQVLQCAADFTQVNPFAGTCFGVFTSKLNWQDADSDCKKRSATLAVFETWESIKWFENLRHTNTTFKDAGWVWIGGRFDQGTGLYNWYGRLGDSGVPILISDWEATQPDGNSGCVQIFDGKRGRANNALLQNYKWDDFACENTNSYVCEQDPQPTPPKGTPAPPKGTPAPPKATPAPPKGTPAPPKATPVPLMRTPAPSEGNPGPSAFIGSPIPESIGSRSKGDYGTLHSME